MMVLSVIEDFQTLSSKTGEEHLFGTIAVSRYFDAAALCEPSGVETCLDFVAVDIEEGDFKSYHDLEDKELSYDNKIWIVDYVEEFDNLDGNVAWQLDIKSDMVM